MTQITPQMGIMVAVEPMDFRAGIDSMAAHTGNGEKCRSILRRAVWIPRPQAQRDTRFGS
jgi:hypothetical protein